MRAARPRAPPARRAGRWTLVSRGEASLNSAKLLRDSSGPVGPSQQKAGRNEGHDPALDHRQEDHRRLSADVGARRGRSAASPPSTSTACVRRPTPSRRRRARAARLQQIQMQALEMISEQQAAVMSNDLSHLDLHASLVQQVSAALDDEIRRVQRQRECHAADRARAHQGQPGPVRRPLPQRRHRSSRRRRPTSPSPALDDATVKAGEIVERPRPADSAERPSARSRRRRRRSSSSWRSARWCSPSVSACG